MNTVNISLPSQLKSQAETLVEDGYYASFSDLVRTALRKLIEDYQLDQLALEAQQEHAAGKAPVLSDKKAITRYLDKM
jgi:putative addiction module CopG family antidote